MDAELHSYHNHQHNGSSPLTSPSANVRGQSAKKMHVCNDAHASCKENGLNKQGSPSTANKSVTNQGSRGFETFVMTGDMIIKTTTPHKKSSPMSSPIHKTSDQKQNNQQPLVVHTPPQKRVSKIPKPTASLSSKTSKSPQAQTSSFKPTQTFSAGPEMQVVDQHERFVNNNSVTQSEKAEENRSHSEVSTFSNHKNNHGAFPDLDIPPDDISSDDYNYRGLDNLMNLDDLPPPPDELLQDYADKSRPLSVSESPQLPVCNSSLKDEMPTNHTHNMPPQSQDLSFVPCTTDTDAHSSIGRSDVHSTGLSKSQEKLTQSVPSVSTTRGKSRSQENRLDNNDITLVDIDLEDSLATSVDAIHYTNESSNSLDTPVTSSSQIPASTRSLDNSPERRLDKPSDRVHMPTFINLEEPKSISRQKSTGSPKGVNITDRSPGDGVSSDMRYEYSVNDNIDQQMTTNHYQRRTPSRNSPSKNSSPTRSSPTRSPPTCGSPTKYSPTRGIAPFVDPSIVTIPEGSLNYQLQVQDNQYCEGYNVNPPSPEKSDSDSESMYHQPYKDVDQPSAQRLAKRLFNLEGFKKSDVCKQLGKKNDFAYLVGEEYVRHFDFTRQPLDLALRSFLKQLTLSGETQERERILAHFSRHYLACNPGSFNSDDACHTLTCAMMLLNTDLHNEDVRRKMTINEFVENLAELNDGEDFPRDTLRQIYMGIKTEPLECDFEEEMVEFVEIAPGQRAPVPDPAMYALSHNPFLEVPDPSKTTEYKNGYIMRKCVCEPDGRKTAMGKRSWKMFYASLRDMVLYLHKDEQASKKMHDYGSMSNSIRVHHALATKATDYKKKQHVIRLQTADWSQYLLQTRDGSDSKECQEWIDTINFVAASLSAPPLPSGVGSQQRFQRALMPSSYTKLNLRDQLSRHEQQVVQLERDLNIHRASPPPRNAKSRIIQDYAEKEIYLQYEFRRFKTYCFLLQAKMATYPELEPSLVEVAIGEVDELPSPSSSPPQHGILATSPATKQTAPKPANPVQRSASDRYSYRAAVYKPV